MKAIKYIVTAIVASAISGVALAHHSFTSHFDPTKTFPLEGVLTKFDMRNPHSFFFLEVEGDNGEIETWEVEVGSAVHLSRMGIKRNTFEIGETMKFSAWPNRVPGRKFVYGINFMDEEGARYGDYPEDKVELAASTATGVDAVFGRWFSPLPYAHKLPAMDLNEAGLLAEKNYIPALSPATSCEPATIPDLQISPYMTDIRMEGDKIIVTHEAYNVIRTIPLNSPQVPVEETGWMGTASARIDGDELVIESSNYPVSRWGLGGAAQPKGPNRVDHPSSSLKQVVERYSVSEDGQTISLTFTLDDPAYLNEPYTATMTATRVSDTEPMFPFDCEVDAAARFHK